VEKVNKMRDYFQATLKDKEFRCVLNKQLLCVLPAAAEGGRYRRTTLRTTRSKRKSSRGRTKYHSKARN